MKSLVWKCCMLFAMVHAAVPLHAQHFAAAPSPQSSAPSGQASSPTNEKLAQLDKRVTAAQSSADNAWMLVSAALVLMMTGPGLALFYGGFVGGRNKPGIIMKKFLFFAVCPVDWGNAGSSLGLVGVQCGYA